MQNKKILFLYADLMSYTISVLNTLASLGHSIHVIHWNGVNENYTNSHIHKNIYLYSKKNLNRAKLLKKVKDTNVLFDYFTFYYTVHEFKSKEEDEVDLSHRIPDMKLLLKTRKLLNYFLYNPDKYIFYDNLICNSITYLTINEQDKYFHWLEKCVYEWCNY